MSEKLCCVNCEKKYKMFMFENYNLNLCPYCFEKFETDGTLQRDEWVDKVTHVITCPLCGQKYGMEICNHKCKTKSCPVYFHWDSLDCRVIARWIKNE